MSVEFRFKEMMDCGFQEIIDTQRRNPQSASRIPIYGDAAQTQDVNRGGRV